MIENIQKDNELRPHQEELLVLAELAGIHMNKVVFRNVILLLNMGIDSTVIFNLLKTICKSRLHYMKKSRHSRSSRSSVVSSQKSKRT